jgi:general secretion pathway protein D
VLEVQLSDGLDVGTSSHGGIPVGDSAIGFGGVQAPSLKSMNLSSLATASGLIGGLVGGPLANSETLLGTSISSYGLLFQALATKSNTNVLSAPSIIALDNSEAKYKVGTNIPYKKGLSIGGLTGTSIPGSVGTNIDRIDLQLELTIKPHISTNDEILLEVKHESRDLEGKDPELGATWNTRSIDTRVLVRDQNTVVIGGLIQERELVDTSQVPILGDIPLLGHLFKYTSKTKRKTNLVVMLTPYIIKDQLDLQALRERKLREHDELVGSFHRFSAMHYVPQLDYRRKRGLLEDINRTLQTIDGDAAALERFRGKPPVTVVPGPVELDATRP